MTAHDMRIVEENRPSGRTIFAFLQILSHIPRNYVLKQETAVHLDSYDKLILRALQRNGSLTNAELSQTVHLSASQISRRRIRLEANGVIESYAARVNPVQLGFGIHAIVRINLRHEKKGSDVAFMRWLEIQPEVQSAYSVSGDADYILNVRAQTLDDLADFMHEKLLLQPQVTQVRSDIVLKSVKENAPLDVDSLP